jgi:cytochrome c-type biogenesis protein CcmH
VIALIIAAVLLTGVTLGLLLLPLIRKPRSAADARAEFDLRVYRDQLAEVDRDAQRGLLRGDEAAAARVEVQRRMLSTAAAVEADQPLRNTPPSRRASAGVLAAIVLGLPMAATLLYATLGAPRSADRPLAERRSELAAASISGDQQTDSLERVAAQLAKKLETSPDSAEGWFLLGRAYVTLGRYQDAVGALRRARDLAPDRPEVANAFAEAWIAEAGGQVGEEAREALQKALVLDPRNPQARFLLALDRAQQGDLRGAVQGWTDLIAIAPAGATWLPVVHQHLEEAARQAGIDPATVDPSAEARALVAASETGPAAAAAREVSPQQRSKMIQGMVDRLAARLQDNPDDLEGWRRLARAYQVLGEADKARDAQARIDALERR